MSIPKDPRQLMINLMYLVLTALLALNVSAEVMNAFFSLDNSINSTNEILKTANNKVIESMEKNRRGKDAVPTVGRCSKKSGKINC
jgi:hypothetical protein